MENDNVELVLDESALLPTFLVRGDQGGDTPGATKQTRVVLDWRAEASGISWR